MCLFVLGVIITGYGRVGRHPPAPHSLPMCVLVLFCGPQDQYIFIHDAILESVTCGDTQIESGNLRARLNKLQRRNQSGQSGIDLQFVVSSNSPQSLL